MKEPELSLKIHPNFPIPINVQVKEQIKWLIGTGIIKPGEFLPPTNQLAEQLQLNRNTVNWVYNQLRDEGLVSLQKGKGTQVKEGVKVDELIANREELRNFIQKLTQEAAEQDLSLEEVIVPTFAYHQLFHLPSDRPKLRIQLIECKEHDYTFYKTEIEHLAHAEVEIILLEEVKGAAETEENIEDIDWIITTWSHQEEVKKLFAEASKKILTITVAPQLPMLIDIARLKSGSKVAFIGSGIQGGHWMAERVKDAGINQIESIPQGIDSLDQLFIVIEQADHLYVFPSIYERIKKLAPEKTNMFSLQLEKSSETLLKELAGHYPQTI